MNYEEAKEFKEINPVTYDKMKAAVVILISNKNIAIKSSKVEEMNLGDSFDLLFEQYLENSSFILKRKERLIGIILLNILEDSIGKEISNDLVTAFSEIDKFLIHIKQPKPRNTWYMHLDSELLEFVLLKFYKEHGFNLIRILKELENDDEREKYRHPGSHFYNYEMYFFEVLNEMHINIEEYYNLVSTYYPIPKYSNYVKGAIEDFCSVYTKGLALYKHGRENQSHTVLFFNATCLIEISKSNLEYAYYEAINLKNISESDCIVSLMFFKYDSTERLMASYNLVLGTDFNKFDKLRFYCKALSNEVINDNQINISFNEINKMIDPTDTVLYSQIFFWITSIEGRDKYKEEILAKILSLDLPYDPNSFYSKYNDKKFLFKHIKERYTQYKGLIHNFQSIFHHVYMENKDVFQNEVFMLLCSEINEEALLAIEIINCNYHGLFVLEYLKLSEENQLIAFERLTSSVLIFKDIIPLLITFGNSEYQSVIKMFKSKCIGFIEAFGSDFIIKIEAHIDRERHKQILDDLKVYNAKLEESFELKNAINEFNPYLNYYPLINKYTELEGRKMAILQERAKSNNESILSLGKTISVIRGSAFKFDGNDQITKLNTISSSTLVDKRMYQDPIKFEERYNNVFKTNKGEIHNR